MSLWSYVDLDLMRFLDQKSSEKSIFKSKYFLLPCWSYLCLLYSLHILCATKSIMKYF